MSERCRLRQASNDILLQLLFNVVPFERNIAFDVPECDGVLIINPSPEELMGSRLCRRLCLLGAVQYEDSEPNAVGIDDEPEV